MEDVDRLPQALHAMSWSQIAFVPLDGSMLAVDALSRCSDARPIHHMASVMIGNQLDDLFAAAQGHEELPGFADGASQIIFGMQQQQGRLDLVNIGQGRACLWLRALIHREIKPDALIGE